MRILYVEDNETNQALVERVARAKRHDIVFCEEGEEALQLLAADPTFDLILMDVELAGTYSGLDVIREMRARNDTRPVVALTAYAMMGDRERILAAGSDQYIPKPLIIPDLLALLDHYEAETAARAATPAPDAVSPAGTSPAPAADTAVPEHPAGAVPPGAPTVEPPPAAQPPETSPETVTPALAVSTPTTPSPNGSSPEQEKS